MHMRAFFWSIIAVGIMSRYILLLVLVAMAVVMVMIMIYKDVSTADNKYQPGKGVSYHVKIGHL